MTRFTALFATAALCGGLALTACSGAPSVSAAKPTAKAGGAQAAAATTGQKAPGPFTANGSVDGSSGTVSMEMFDTMKFQPNVIEKVKAGSQVTVELKNSGATLHDFISPALGVDKAVLVQAGKSGTVTFTAPSAPGRYQFWCNQPGHPQAGMVGEVVVE